MNNDNEYLATRWQRWWASLIDSLTIMVIIIPLAYLTGAFDMMEEGVQLSFIYNLGITIVSTAFFGAINYKSLISNGQTIGKKVLNIQIVDLEDNIPTPKNLLIRYLGYFGFGQIPIVGGLVSLINILFIFGTEKRCGHDYIAGTKVVQVEN
jgi:uncharacterized RDD family membrane protein YckC